MYCLWLNGKKVFTLQQLRTSFDAEAVELYCLGGGLARWLRDCGEHDTAEKVEHIDLSKNIAPQLAEIFGVDLPEKEEQAHCPATTPKPPSPTTGSSFDISSSFTSDTSFFSGSFFTTFDTSSFTFSNIYTSFFTTSFLTTSFSGGNEHEYEYESGSFAAGSFSLYLSSFFAESAFLTGSFSFGSFSPETSSFTPESGSFRLTLSSFSANSLQAKQPSAPIPEQEHAPLTPRQKFELNLSSCPLNRYGYGIHII